MPVAELCKDTDHLFIDDTMPYQDYLLQNWRWNKAKFRVQGRELTQVVDNLAEVSVRLLIGDSD
jgi:hypothetical protein